MNGKIRPFYVAIKALCLFTAINIFVAVFNTLPTNLSLYNHLVSGRVRFSFGDANDPYIAANDEIDVMIASHAISGDKHADEYRVALIGDSSVWGENLLAHQTIAVQWNAMQLGCANRTFQFYNLGYPHPSVIKDVLILDKVMEHDPDLIIWFVTLNGLYPRRVNPFLVENHVEALRVLNEYDIPFQAADRLELEESTWFQRTLWGRRESLARYFKLQGLGFVWEATGMDLSPSFLLEEKRINNLEFDTEYRGQKETPDLKRRMLFSAFAAGHQIAEAVPILLVNEPMFIATGKNSEVRYNIGYPRWAYDQYRQAMDEETTKNAWRYLDLWDRVAADLFADSVLHLSADGERALIEEINPALFKIACP